MFADDYVYVEKNGFTYNKDGKLVHAAKHSLDSVHTEEEKQFWLENLLLKIKEKGFTEQSFKMHLKPDWSWEKYNCSLIFYAYVIVSANNIRELRDTWIGVCRHCEKDLQRMLVTLKDNLKNKLYRKQNGL